MLLGEKIYKSHELTYAGELITCAHCGHPITGELVLKKRSGKQYVYYRCTKYAKADHPRIRLTEAQLDAQVLALFARIKQPDVVRDWFERTLRAWMRDQQESARANTDEVQRQLTLLRGQQDRLLNLRLLDEITADTFAAKSTELRDRITALTLQLEAADRGRDEQADLALKVFELSQSLQEKWLAADCSEKRQILNLLCLNLKLDDITLVPTIRKPFDILIEGPFVSSSGETGIRTPDTGLTPYNGLANRRLQPLGHLSGQDIVYSTQRQNASRATEDFHRGWECF